MKKTILAFLSLVCLNTVVAQKLEYENYDWSEPKKYELTKEEQTENAITLFEKRIIEFAYEDGQLLMFITKHQIIRVNDEKGIEQKNKVYLPVGGVIDVLNIKARSVSKDGKITLLNKSNIKDVENYEDSGPYKIFAFEGVEAGSTIEYCYTLKRNANFFSSEYIQNETRKQFFEMLIISPDNLIYEAKVYNVQVDKTVDTTEDGRNRVTMKCANMVDLKDEAYAAASANRGRVEYKLAYNKARSKARLFTWEEAASQFYNNIMRFEKKELSSVAAFLKKNKIDKMEDDEKKVRAFESLIKNSFNIKQEGGDDFRMVNKIIENKMGNSTGILRLYAAAFKQMNLNFEFVCTTDRFERKFDPDFDSWNFLAEEFFYLPDLDLYLSPTTIFSRAGYIPSGYTGTKGIFIKELSMGDLTSGIGKIKDIKTLPLEKSYSNIYTKVDFTSIEEPKITVSQHMLGHSGENVQPLYQYLDQEKKDEFLKSSMQLFGEEVKILKSEVLNTAEEDLFVKPFIIQGEVLAPLVVEKAGNKYMFKLGVLIGRQSELYQETKRQEPAEIEYLHSFERKIEFEIPEGYKISNPDDMNSNVTYKDGDKVLAEFKSSYEITGNKVTVKVYEAYGALFYPLERFEDFKKVINAAADFNKVTLIFEK